MDIFFTVASIVVFFFGGVIFFCAPYLPTLGKQTQTALDMLDLKPGQTLLELGSGDGRVLKAAAKRGIHAIGYELNPLLVLISLLHTWRYRKHVKIIWGNYWNAQWPKADGVFTFLLDKYMKKLDKKLTREMLIAPGQEIKVVSYAFKIPNKKPLKQSNAMYLYLYKS